MGEVPAYPQALAARDGRKAAKALRSSRSVPASDPIVRAKSQLALSLAKLLCTLGQQLKLYRKQIEALFRDHPDHDLFGSLPGAKQMLAPRLLASVGGDPGRYGSQKPPVHRGDRAGLLSIRKLNKVRVPWPATVPAPHRASVGGLFPQGQRLGPDLLSTETRRGQDARLCFHVPGSAIA